MKYIWIIILILVYLMWLWASLTDIIYSVKNNKKGERIGAIDDLTIVFIAMHIVILFVVSVVNFIFSYI